MTLPYNFWKEALRIDAWRNGKAYWFNNTSDFVLEVFYERRCQPSIESILHDIEKAA